VQCPSRRRLVTGSGTTTRKRFSCRRHIPTGINSEIDVPSKKRRVKMIKKVVVRRLVRGLVALPLVSASANRQPRGAQRRRPGRLRGCERLLPGLVPGYQWHRAGPVLVVGEHRRRRGTGGVGVRRVRCSPTRDLRPGVALAFPTTSRMSRSGSWPTRCSPPTRECQLCVESGGAFGGGARGQRSDRLRRIRIRITLPAPRPAATTPSPSLRESMCSASPPAAASR